MLPCRKTIETKTIKETERLLETLRNGSLEVAFDDMLWRNERLLAAKSNAIGYCASKV